MSRRGLGVCRTGHGAAADPHPDARALLRVAVQANGCFARAHNVVVRARPLENLYEKKIKLQPFWQ